MGSQILIVGGGAAGTAVAASLLKRDKALDVKIIEPSDAHYYQPGWTMVGGGVFDASKTVRLTDSLIPAGARRVRGAVAAFDPTAHEVTLEDGQRFGYDQLVVCPGLELHWAGVEGLQDALGREGVTSNYRFDLAPYTWRLTQSLRKGRAIFTQPAAPIKCAGAPQKAMYFSADHWRRQGALPDIEVEFRTAGASLFAVEAYVPALTRKVSEYGIGVHFGETLVAVDPGRKTAVFKRIDANGEAQRSERAFDMLHVVPPQRAPRIVRDSVLADASGWLELSPATLRHQRYADVWGLGDASGTTNSKTAAAVRKQAPVVATNLLDVLAGREPSAVYDGYAACPIVVSRGQVVLAEFAYGGVVSPSFPTWLIDGTRPSALAWELKKTLLPALYWNGMLRGHEWLAKPIPAR